MGSIDFYKNLPAQTHLTQVFDGRDAASVPEDWFVAVTDVVGSTQAIEAGRYKDVNVAGGLSVIAVSNAFEDMEFPFVFGGDGVTMLIPGDFRDRVADILYDTSLRVRELYDLDLRVGLVPVRELTARGQELSCTKLRVSEYYDQAILRGNGASLAEDLVKSKTSEEFRLKGKLDPSVQADFTGFTCRWQDIRSMHGETISIIIKLRDEGLQPGELNRIYSEILDKIQEIFGSEDEYHPLNETTLKVASDTEYLGREARAQAGSKSGLAYLKELIRIKVETYATRLAIRFKLGLKAFWYDLSKLKEYQILSCDFRKYDGTLKMVIACTYAARTQLEEYLEGLYREGKIYYGVHSSDRALMTCVLHASSEREVHFVDAADGGYALAARQLKRQVRDA